MSESNHPSQYGAKEGSKRDKQLDQTKKDLEKAKDLKAKGKAGEAQELEQKAYRRRDRMERQEREKNESTIRAYIREVLLKEKCDLSKKTKKTLKKKAEEKGYTPGSVEKEFCAGLGAYNTSGSRPGMTPQQWAHARVNKATPSKDWAVVKKSKAKKK